VYFKMADETTIPEVLDILTQDIIPDTNEASNTDCEDVADEVVITKPKIAIDAFQRCGKFVGSQDQRTFQKTCMEWKSLKILTQNTLI